MKILLLMVMLFTLAGCVTQQKCLEKFPPKETVREFYSEIRKDSVIKIPSATVYDTIRIDSIRYYPVNRWFTVKDTSGLAELKIKIDQYGNLVASCEAKEKEFIKTLIERTQNSESQKSDIKTTSEFPWWFKFVLTANLIIIVSFLLEKIIKFLKRFSFPWLKLK